MRILVVLLTVVAMLATSPLFAIDIVTTFTGSLGNWTGEGVTFRGNFGSPGGDQLGNGFARFDDEPNTSASVLEAPSQYLGSWLSYKDVGALSYDHRILAASLAVGFAPYRIDIAGPLDSATWLYEPTATGVTPWLRRVAPIKESAWIVVGDWNRLLSDITKLEIQIEHVSNNPQGGGTNVEGIDNVKLFTLPPNSADFDDDNDVDGIDFLTWQRNQGVGTFFHQGDANNDGAVDGGDLAIWESQYAGAPPIMALPEPATGVLLLTLAALSGVRRLRVVA